MNIQFNNGSNLTKLSTDRTLSALMIRGICSFAILALIDMMQMQNDLNTIIKPYTRKKANWGFFGFRSWKIMKEELERRGINYQLDGFFSYTKSITALNLLCADFNERGC